MKLNNYLYLGCLVIMTMLSSCSQDSSNQIPIPKDAHSVGFIDAYSLYQKADLDDNTDFLDKIMGNDAVNNNTSKIIKNVIKNPLESGIDLRENINVFDITRGGVAFDVFVAKMHKSGKYEDLIKSTFENQTPNITEKGNYKFYQTKGMATGWTSDLVIIIESKNRTADFVEVLDYLFGLKPENHISSNENFQKFLQKDADISLWTNTNNSIAKTTNLLNIDKESQTAFYVDFEKEKLTINQEIFPSKKMEEQLGDYDFLNKNFDSDILRFFPESSFISGGISVDPKALLEVAMRNNKKYSLEDAEKKFEKETGLSLEEVYESIEGNIGISVLGIDKVVQPSFFGGADTEVVIPKVGIAIEMNDDKVYQALLNQIKKLPGLKEEDRYYSVMIFPPYEISFTYNKDILLISNDLKSVQLLAKGERLPNNLSKSSKISKLSDNPGFAHINLDIDNYSEEMKAEFIKNMKVKDLVKYEDLMSFSIQIKDPLNYEYIANTKGNKNSFATLLKLIIDSK